MEWVNGILDWLGSPEGRRVTASTIIPAIAIIVSGIIAGLIGRGSTKRVIAQYNRDALTAAVQALVLAGRKAAGWNAIGTIERVQVDHLIGEAETRIRLLPVPGAALAANWAAHQLEDMKRNSAGFSFQAQQTLAEYRDRLIAWSEKPRQAKKLFGADLERWKYEADPAEQQLVADQARWEAERTPERETAAVTPVVSTTAAPPASDAATAVGPMSHDEPPVTPPNAGTPLVVSTPFAPRLTTTTSSPGGEIDARESDPVPTQAFVVERRSGESPSAPGDDGAPPPMPAQNVRDRIDPQDEN
ncbi:MULTISPECIES: hypothetical protein [unclassified Microcella]|uniref:hypothetical protein n=1 Tax=unclassified Microcella TaxID=2630066 RepID=UPI0006F6D884|nr:MULTISPECIES: hypothetical protein [unclassified Microcella]KQV24653.1 hypothetical protein ASC54_09025 [Yonghaparkia sp. Root332]KRF30943.1 hypothetical protein ASG83_08855 [Yonghaparkia sp. Soil809]